MEVKLQAHYHGNMPFSLIMKPLLKNLWVHFNLGRNMFVDPLFIWGNQFHILIYDILVDLSPLHPCLVWNQSCDWLKLKAMHWTLGISFSKWNQSCDWPKLWEASTLGICHYSE